jgi:hypothetical protein
MSDKPNYEAGFGSDAMASPQRVVFVTRKTSAKVRGPGERQVMSFPHLLMREAIVLEVVTIVLVVIGLLWDAPLEQLANPLVTPNPAKAPWYFLGLQELLHYFPPVVAGILIPTLVVVALVVIPYSRVNIEGAPLWENHAARRFRIIATVLVAFFVFLVAYDAWTVLVPTVVASGFLVVSYLARPESGRWARYLRGRPLSWWVMSWFIAVSVTLTVVGTFFRGPGWSWVWPWR